MAIVSDVEIRLRADIARLQQDLTRARQQVSGFTSGVKNLVGGMFAGFAIGSVVSQVVNAQREFEKLRASLVTVTGSSASAGKAMEAIQKFAAQTPFSLQEVTEGFLKLRNMGLTPSERALMSYGNTASAMGKNLNQMVEAVADATTGEFERLKEFGIKAKQEGDKVQLTFQGVTKTIGNNAAEIEEYLLRIGEVEFAGGMSRQADTLDGDLSNLSDTFSQTLTLFSQGSGFGDLLRGSVQALSAALSDLGAMFKAIGGDAEDEGKKIEAIAPLHKFLTTVFEALTVVGVNVAYVFKTIAKDIGNFAAQAVALFNGGFKGLIDGTSVKAIKAISNARTEEAKRERAEVDATSARILGAAAKNQAARAKDEADRKKGIADALAGYKIQSQGVKTVSDAEKKAAEERKKAADQRAKEAARELQAYREMQAAVDQRIAETAREADGLEPLNEGERLNLELTEKLALGKIKLTAAQEANLRAGYAVIAQNLENARALATYDDHIKELRAEYDRLLEKRASELEAGRKEVESNQELITTFGMTESAIARLTVARLKDQLARADDDNLNQSEIEHLQKVIALKEQSADAIAAREELEAARKFWTDIDQVAHDTFVSIADGGKDTWRRLKDTAKNVFFDWLYQMTVRKWIINIGTSLSGSGAVSGIANGSGVAGGFLNTLLGSASGGGGILGTVGNLYSALSGGMTLGGGLGTGFIGSLAGGLNGAGIGSGLASGLGLQIGNSIASVVGPNIAGAISSGLGSLAAAAPWVAGAVALFSVAKKAFGHGPKQYSGNSTLSGWITGNGQLDANMFAEWTKKGGWFRSDKSGSDRMPVGQELAAGILSTYETIKTSTMEYAAALGVNADFIKNRAQGLNIALGQDEAANQAAITQFFSDAADHVAREVLPSMALFQKEGETAAQTLQRMATNASGVEQVFAMFGTTMDAVLGPVGNASMLARERLVELAGGVQNLGSMAAFFQQNILSEADRVRAVQGPLNNALASLGYTSLKTTDDLKAAVLGLMESGALATEEGAKQYAGLLALAPQFKMVADYMAQLADAGAEVGEELPDLDLLNRKRELQIQIMELEGNALGALAETRRMELEQADASLRPLMERVYALQDEAAAAERLAQAKSDNEQMLNGIVDDAMAALGRAVQAQKDRVTAAYKDTMAGLDAGIKRVNETIQRTGELSKALRGAIMAPEGGDSAMRGQVARAQISTALAIARASGVLPTAESLADALAAVGMDSTDDFATLQEYQRAVARTNAELEALGGLTDKELSTAEKQLKALEDQKTAAEVAYEAELSRLDKIVETAQAQVDEARGIKNGVTSVEAALAALGTALGALKTAPTATSPGGVAGGAIRTVEDLYRQVLGRAPDAAGLEFWKKAFGESVDESEYLEFVKSAKPELASPPPMVVTGSGTMSSSSAMVAELQTLNRRMESVEVNMANTAKATDQFAAQFNQVSGGGNALATEII